MQNNFEPFLDSQQAAELLRIQPKTLQAMARRGKVLAHRIGDLWRYRASVLDVWLRTATLEDATRAVSNERRVSLFTRTRLQAGSLKEAAEKGGTKTSGSSGLRNRRTETLSRDRRQRS